VVEPDIAVLVSLATREEEPCFIDSLLPLINPPPLNFFSHPEKHLRKSQLVSAGQADEILLYFAGCDLFVLPPLRNLYLVCVRVCQQASKQEATKQIASIKISFRISGVKYSCNLLFLGMLNRSC